MKTARTRFANRTAYDVNSLHLPARLAQRRIERVVVTAEHHGSVVAEQRAYQIFVIAVVELMLVAPGLARS